MFGLEAIMGLAAAASAAADAKAREELGLPQSVTHSGQENPEPQEYKPGWLVWAIFLSAIF